MNTLYDTVVKRVLDVTLAVTLTALFSPLLVAASLALLALNNGKVLERTPKLGRDCRPFQRYSFAMRGGRLRHLPVLFNIIKGDLSFVGPRPGAPGEFCPECCASLSPASAGLAAREAAARLRGQVRPGLISEWWIQRHVSQAYDPESCVDAEYVKALSLRNDAGLALRALPALLGHLLAGGSAQAHREVSDRFPVLGVTVDNLTMSEAIDRILALMDEASPRHVCFFNPQYANSACSDAEYRALLAQADLVLPDGIGMKIACIILGEELKQNVNGTDLFPRLCHALSAGHKSMYLLGAAPGVAEGARDWVEQNHPGITVKGCRNGYFTPEEETSIVADIAASGADLLLVAMGVPRQEFWIRRHLPGLGVKVAMGVGGLFDFYSGHTRRAPLWVREIGMEWFYRVCQEPGRMWKRYLVGNNLFLWRVLMSRLRDRDRHP